MEDKAGKITRQQDGYEVVFERTLNHHIQKVWEAITQPEKLRYWFTDIEMDFNEGGDLKITFRDQDKMVTHGKIIKIDPPNRFEYTWEGDLAVWELSALGENQCKLRLTYAKVDQEYLRKTPVGWHMLLDQLANMLSGTREILPFGNEVENDPGFQRLLKLYNQLIDQEFPELKGL